MLRTESWYILFEHISTCPTHMSTNHTESKSYLYLHICMYIYCPVVVSPIVRLSLTVL